MPENTALPKGYCWVPKYRTPLDSGGNVTHETIHGSRTGLKVREDLLRIGKTLSVEVCLRSSEGPGIPYRGGIDNFPLFDLAGFYKRIGELSEHPRSMDSTATIATGSLTARMKISPARDPDDIEYVNASMGYTDSRPYLFPRNQMQAEYSLKDAPGYISNLLGLTGLRFAYEISPMAVLGGGMENSSIFSLLSGIAATAAGGTGFSLPDNAVFALGVENECAKSGGGLQGPLSVIGGANLHCWFEGENGRDKDGWFVNPSAAFSIPFVDPNNYERLSECMALAHPGKQIVDWRPAEHRISALASQMMYNDLIREQVPAAQTIYLAMQNLTAKYMSAFQNMNLAEVVNSVNEFVDRRDELCRLWIKLAVTNMKVDWIDRIGPEDKRVLSVYGLDPDNARRVSDRIDNNAVGLKTQIFERLSWMLSVGSSPFSDYARPMIDAGRQNGIAVKPLGAGCGSNVEVYSPDGKAGLARFFEGLGIPIIEDDAVLSQSIEATGMLKCWRPLVIGSEGITFSGFKELGYETPEMPPFIEFQERK